MANTHCHAQTSTFTASKAINFSPQPRQLPHYGKTELVLDADDDPPSVIQEQRSISLGVDLLDEDKTFTKVSQGKTLVQSRRVVVE